MTGRRFGHYVVLEKIGEGGMGTVYRARDEHLERDVAIKLLRVGMLDDLALRERLRREARILSRLNHPNICTVFDFDSQDGVDFLAVELVPGNTIAERVCQGPMPEPEVVRLGIQIAEALAAAHESGVIHRDLKPGNVMLTPKGNAKVLDFGIARLIHAPGMDLSTLWATRGDEVAGTLQYMAPEQLLGRESDGRADVYALGALLYEASTGQAPFRNSNEAALVDSILHARPTSPRAIRSDLSPRFDEIVLRALEKDPELRQSTAKELADDLQKLAGALASGSLPRARRRWMAFRQPKVRLLAAIAVAAVVIALGLHVVVTRERGIDSLAVLPFANATADTTTEYLSDGIPESITNTLSTIGDLKVIAHTSTFRYKGRTVAPAEAARALGVRAIVTGRVVKRQDALEISVELVDAKDDRQLWGRRFQTSIDNLEETSREISQSVAEMLRVPMTESERDRLAKDLTGNSLAYRYYLEGRYELNRATEAHCRRALELFRRATTEDPGFALAYSGLADAYYGLSNLYLPAAEVMPKARAAAARALALDPNVAEAHASMAFVLSQYDWDWTRAEQEYRRAIELNPGYAYARAGYGLFLTAHGRNQEARKELLRAKELDPLAPAIAGLAVIPLVNSGNHEAAIRELQLLLREEPGFHVARVQLALIHAWMGQCDKSVAIAQQAVEHEPTAYNEVQLTYCLARCGRDVEARDLLRKIESARPSAFASLSGLASVYGELGDRDKAFQLLEESFREREEPLALFKVDPHFQALGEDPRFREMCKKLGFES